MTEQTDSAGNWESTGGADLRVVEKIKSHATKDRRLAEAILAIEASSNLRISAALGYFTTAITRENPTTPQYACGYALYELIQAFDVIDGKDGFGFGGGSDWLADTLEGMVHFMRARKEMGCTSFAEYKPKAAGTLRIKALAEAHAVALQVALDGISFQYKDLKK